MQKAEETGTIQLKADVRKWQLEMELLKFLVETSRGFTVLRNVMPAVTIFQRTELFKTSQLNWLLNRLKTIQQSVESLCIIRHQVKKPMTEWRYGSTHSKLGTRWRWQSALRPGQARPRPVWTDYTTENISPLTSLERLLGQPAEWRMYQRDACLNLIYWLVTSSTVWQGKMKICSRVQHSCWL